MTMMEAAEAGHFSSHNYAGRNLHFGIREHGMAAICNGLSLCGLRAYGATFFVFTDYMRPSMRLASIMHQPVTYVLTHDSIGLGEDGPTHQPVEHLASLRAMPGMTVIRPADPSEAVEAWRWLMGHKEGPVGLVLSRQKLPVFDREKFAPASGLAQGAYVLVEAEAPAGTEPRLLLLATGSEVALAVAAREKLQAEGIPTRVVSMPSWEIFARQPQEVRDRVLPPGITARLSIEAGVSLGWRRWVGDRGASIAVDRFGASAPGEKALAELGFNVDNVIQKAKALL